VCLWSAVVAAFLCTLVTTPEADAQRGGGEVADGEVSEGWVELYEPHVHNEMPYRLMKPIHFDSNKRYPVVVSLHGGGGRGADNRKQLRGWNKLLAEEQRRSDYPCYVLAPQANRLWDAAYLKNIKDVVAALPSVDMDKIYILGHSMGGHGTYILIQIDPDYFAAAAPSAGSGLPRTEEFIDASLIKDVPIWAFHGDKDKVCPIERDQKLFAEMEELGGNMKYTELKDVKHNASRYAFSYEGDEPEKSYVTQYSSERCDKTANVWDWLFAQRLDKRAQEESGKKHLIDFRDSSSIRNQQPILIAHRGGVVTAQSPECSIAAIRLAKQQGYDMVELDIRQSKDHVPIVFHDNDMKKACGINKSINDLSADEIVKITYVNTDQMICTLDQALSVCHSQELGLMLDVKITGDEQFFKKIVTLIKKHGYENSSITINGDPDLRKHLREIALLTVTQDEFNKVQQGLSCDLRNKFWFGLPHRLPSGMVKPLQQNGAYVIPAINTFRYPADGHYELARKDIQRLNEAGADGYQIDSVYRPLFLEKKREK